MNTNPQTLYAAVSEGNVEAVRFGIAIGGDVNGCHRGITLVEVAMQKGHPQIVETLLAAGASVERELESTLEQWADNEGHVFVRDALRRSAMRTR
jgi:ankyrin repeat protein